MSPVNPAAARPAKIQGHHLDAGRSTMSASPTPSRSDATPNRPRSRPNSRSGPSPGAGPRNASASSMATRAAPAPPPPAATISPGCSRRSPWATSAWSSASRSIAWPVEDEDCCRLIKVCAAFDTLMADQDGLYHPHRLQRSDGPDVQGHHGGFELHQLQQRMQAGRLNRLAAANGWGNRRRATSSGPTANCSSIPTSRSRGSCGWSWSEFAALGSISGVLRHLRQHGIQLPCRPLSGPGRGQLQWHPPHRETLRQSGAQPGLCRGLHLGPMRDGSATRPAGSARQRPRPPRGRRSARCSSRQPRRVPQLGAIPGQPPPPAAAPQAGPGARARRGRRWRSWPGWWCAANAAVACRHITHEPCVMRASGVRWITRSRPVRAWPATALERLVRDQVLQVVTPAGLELSLRAAQECRARTGRPGSPMAAAAGAGGPGRRACLPAVQRRRAGEPPGGADAGTAVGRGPAGPAEPWRSNTIGSSKRNPCRLSAAERARIEALAGDMPALWQAPTTDGGGEASGRAVAVAAGGGLAPASSQEVKVQLHWSRRDGDGASGRRRAVRRWEQVADAATVCQHVQGWQAAGWTSRRIADELNAAGHRTPRDRPVHRRECAAAPEARWPGTGSGRLASEPLPRSPVTR